MELPTDFKNLLSAIEPSASHVSKAKTAHEGVREFLRTNPDSRDAHKDSFLSGSYARSTAIHDINDVDVVCLLDLDTNITTPEVVLAWLQGILAARYKEVKRQGRSIGIKDSNSVWLDIVPAAALASDDGPLVIPDRESRQWVTSHPKGQMAAAISKNKITSGYYIQTVKLLKCWRDRISMESAKPKSYILESMVYWNIGYPMSHAGAVVNVLEGILRVYGGSGGVPTIPDPGYSSVNVAKRWELANFNAFIQQVSADSVIARQALTSPDQTLSRTLWRKLFGSGFGK